MSSKRVLILGASLMQVPALEAVRRMGHVAIAADGNDCAVGIAHAHQFWHVDLRNTERLIRKAQKEHLDAVLTCATDFSYAVSRIAQACSLHGIAPPIAHRANFKDAMRECFARHEIASPTYLLFHSSKDEHMRGDSTNAVEKFGERALQYLGLPLVIKPVDNMGARGVSVVEEESEFCNACMQALHYSSSGIIIAERKLQGPELSIDSFVLDGMLYPIGTADRHIVFSPYFVETGHSIPSKIAPHLQQDAHAALHKAAGALGISHGVCKGDIIFNCDKAHIGECAARLSGGYMSGWTIPYAYGIDPAEHAVMLALDGTLCENSKAQLHEIASSCVVVERAFLTLPGTLRKVHIPKHLQHVPALPQGETMHGKEQPHEPCGTVRNVIVTASVGTRYFLPKNNTDKVGSVITTGSTLVQANATAADVLSHVYFEVYLNNEANAFLYSNAKDTIRDYCTWHCYKKSDEALRQSCSQGMQTLVENVMRCRKRRCLALYIPQGLRESTERGAWTHLNAWDALMCCSAHMPLRVVARKEESINAMALRAFLRAGGQGLHYTLQLIQTCTINALKNFCGYASQY